MQNNIIKLKEQVEQRAKETKDRLKSSGGDGIDSDFIMTCLNRNELGDGELFKQLYRDQFVFNKSMDAWMAWTGHHWQLDKMDFAMASVEGVANVYQDEARRVSKKINDTDAEDMAKFLKSRQSNLNTRVTALRSSRRRKNCVMFAHTSKDPIAIDGNEVDQNSWLLPCKNGVVNLRTGELEPGRPSDYLLKASAVEYPVDGINADFSEWERVLLEIFSGNQNLVDFFRQVCGYSLVGEVSESVLIVLTGRGRNGKSMIVETLSKILGQLSGAIRSEMLLDQNRIASSAGPTPDIMALRGLRMAFASETDDGCKISPSRVKWLTGNDTITGRNPHDKYEVHFKPSHTLFLLTNHKPKAPADDFAFWERVILFPFELSFVDREPANDNERQSDPKLGKQLETMLPQIFAWMVKGCLEWQRMGKLIRPAAVTAAVDDYQSEQDHLSDFIDECCVVGDGLKAKSNQLYDVFVPWWERNISKKYVPTLVIFAKWMTLRFEKRKSGVIWYHGVGIREG